MRITHLIPTSADGGIRRYVEQCITMPEIQSSVITLFAAGEPSEIRLHAEVEIRLEIPVARHRESGMIEKAVAAAVQTLRPDLLHSHHLGCDIFSAASKRHVSSGRMIRHVHGVLQRSSTQPLCAKSVRLDWTPSEIDQERDIEHFAFLTVCVSNELRDKLAGYGLPADKLAVLPNAVDPARFKPSGAPAKKLARQTFGIVDDAFVIGYLGRIEPCKNAGHIVDLASHQRGAIPQLRYLVMGFGPDEPALRQRVLTSGVSEMFSFVPPGPDVQSFYDAIDALILPSITEGSPFVVLEAMASEVAVMASAVGGVREIIRHDVDGLLFDTSDLASSLMAAVKLADPARRSTLARAGRRRVMTAFGLEAHQARIRSLYSEAVHA